MTMRDEDFGATLTLAEGEEGLWSPSMAASVCEPPDWQSLYEQAQARAEQERARADAAETRAEELLVAERTARSQAGSLKWNLDQSRAKLKAAVEEVKKVRRTAKDALFYQSEVARLEKLLSEAGVDSRKRSTITSLRMEVVRLRREVDSLTRENARLGKARERNDELASLRRANARQGKKIEALRTRNVELEARIARLQSTRSALSQALFGSKSEKQKNKGAGRKRGQQRGAPGHGRTLRPGLGEKQERHDPPKDARICSCCGKPYVANGERSTSLIEIEVKAHIRTILRTRWRRGCECASSPQEVTAPPPVRLFDNTPYGVSVWTRFLFEHCVCLRPLSRVAAWMGDQGLAISPGTLADSIKRFVPLFDPLAEAILAHQNTAALRHADETGWRVQEFRRNGRSSRAWLWISVSEDAVYYLIDPSRSAEVAKSLFGDTACTVYVVCDRYSAYRKLARELAGKVVLCWCWAYVADVTMLRRGDVPVPDRRAGRSSATYSCDSLPFAMVLSPTTRRHDHVRGTLHPSRSHSKALRHAAIGGAAALSRALRPGGRPTGHVARDCSSSGQSGSSTGLTRSRTCLRDSGRGCDRAVVAARRASFQAAGAPGCTPEIFRLHGAVAPFPGLARGAPHKATRSCRRGRALRGADAR